MTPSEFDNPHNVISMQEYRKRQIGTGIHELVEMADRHDKVFDLMNDGLSTSEIAAELGLPEVVVQFDQKAIWEAQKR